LLETVGNIQASQALAPMALSPAQRAMHAIRQASAKTGVDFAYLLNNAQQESGLNTTAKAKTSSASGLFQFVEQTWLRMVKTYGDKYGMSAAAEKISIGSDGVARVKDSQAKQAILALRNDPKASACLAAEFTNENKVALEGVLGSKVGATDLYLAHFLGAGGAAEFISEMRKNPNASAAKVLPNAAAANTSVFYKDGKPCTLAQVYKRFAERFDGSCPAAKLKTTKLASAGVSSSASSQADAIGKAFAASSVSGLKNGRSSMTTPFATMMLAQMDMDSFALSAHAKESGSESENNKKKSSLSLPGAVL